MDKCTLAELKEDNRTNEKWRGFLKESNLLEYGKRVYKSLLMLMHCVSLGE